MATDNPARRTATLTETRVKEFLNPPLTIVRRLRRAERLLSREDLPQLIGRLGPEDRKKLIDKLNQVHYPDHQSFPTSSLILFTKVYLAVNVRDKQFLTLFGNFCSAIQQLPPSALLSAELERRGDGPVASGGLTNIWEGRCNGACVTIKAYHNYSPGNLEKAKEVRIHANGNGSLYPNYADSMEAGADVEKAGSSKRRRISRRDHGTLPTRPRLRFGEKRQHCTLRRATSPGTTSRHGTVLTLAC
jgi:hypothetical protein